jgi:predicted MFS family arabinose efflux permease
MLARPVASFLAETVGWRAVFFLSAALMALLMIALAALCPHRRPEAKLGYGAILLSTLKQLRERRALRLRAFYQAMNFAAFNLFWTAAPLVLLHHFHFSQSEVALFALAGAGGALVAPLVGRLADRGHSTMLTVVGTGVSGLAFWATAPAVSFGALAAFAVLAVALDAAVQTNHIASQRIIFAAPADVRGRVNAIYVTCLFAGGALGSFAATGLYERWGWSAVAFAGGAAGIAALALFGVEKISRR